MVAPSEYYLVFSFANVNYTSRVGRTNPFWSYNDVLAIYRFGVAILSTATQTDPYNLPSYRDNITVPSFAIAKSRLQAQTLLYRPTTPMSFRISFSPIPKVRHRPCVSQRQGTPTLYFVHSASSNYVDPHVLHNCTSHLRTDDTLVLRLSRFRTKLLVKDPTVDTLCPVIRVAY